jgi:hypothetical protein
VATDNLEVVAFGVGQPIMDGPIFEGVQTYEQPHPYRFEAVAHPKANGAWPVLLL